MNNQISDVIRELASRGYSPRLELAAHDAVDSAIYLDGTDIHIQVCNDGTYRVCRSNAGQTEWVWWPDRNSALELIPDVYFAALGDEP